MSTYTHSVDFSMLLRSQLLPNCCKHRDIQESSPHRYPPHILSHNYYLPMCISEEIGRQKSPNCSFIHTQSTFRCFYALNFRRLAANMEISRTPYITTTLPCVLYINTSIPCVLSTVYCFYALNFHEMPWIIERSRTQVALPSHVYCRLFTAFMLSTSTKCPES